MNVRFSAAPGGKSVWIFFESPDRCLNCTLWATKVGGATKTNIAYKNKVSGAPYFYSLPVRVWFTLNKKQTNKTNKIKQQQKTNKKTKQSKTKQSKQKQKQKIKPKNKNKIKNKKKENKKQNKTKIQNNKKTTKNTTKQKRTKQNKTKTSCNYKIKINVHNAYQNTGTRYLPY